MSCISYERKKSELVSTKKQSSKKLEKTKETKLRIEKNDSIPRIGSPASKSSAGLSWPVNP